MDDTHRFDFDGGWLCLDFANTLGDRPVALPHEEHLHSYGDLVAWSEQGELLSGEEAADLLRKAAHRPAEAQAAFRRAIALREAIYRVFSAIAAGAEPPADDFATVQHAIAESIGHAGLVRHDGHYDWTFVHDPAPFETVLHPVAWSVAELLTADELRRVRECAGPVCSWLFMDTSKNGSRRWCSMSMCGNRAKARRFRARQTTKV